MISSTNFKKKTETNGNTHQGNCDIAWILPVTMLQAEFGAEARYRGDGSGVLILHGSEQLELNNNID